MRTLLRISLVVLIISSIGFISWRFIAELPVWVARVSGTLMVISVSTFTYSSIRLRALNQ